MTAMHTWTPRDDASLAFEQWAETFAWEDDVELFEEFEEHDDA